MTKRFLLKRKDGQWIDVPVGDPAALIGGAEPKRIGHGGTITFKDKVIFISAAENALPRA